MMNNNLDELLKAIESIRLEKFPDIPNELLEDILRIEYDKQDNRAEALEKVQDVLDKYLSKMIEKS